MFNPVYIIIILLGFILFVIRSHFRTYIRRKSCENHKWSWENGIYRCELCGFHTGRESHLSFFQHVSPRIISRTFTGLWASFLALFDKKKRIYQARIKRRFRRLCADEFRSFVRRLKSSAAALKSDWYILVRYIKGIPKRSKGGNLIYSCNSKTCRFGEPIFRVICRGGVELHVCQRHHPRGHRGIKRIFIHGKEFDIEDTLLRIEYFKHRWWILKRHIDSRREYRNDRCQMPGCYKRARFMVLSKKGKLRICINEHPGHNKDRAASGWIKEKIGPDYIIRSKNKSELRDKRLAVIKERRNKLKSDELVPEFIHMCGFPGCLKVADWLYLDDGRIERRKDYTMLPFFSLENIRLVFRKNPIEESQVVLKTCENHSFENNPWTRFQLRERGWFEKKKAG